MALKFFAAIVSFNKIVQTHNGHHLTQEEQCRNNYPSLIEKVRWPRNSPAFSPLDYSLWDKLINVID